MLLGGVNSNCELLSDTTGVKQHGHVTVLLNGRIVALLSFIYCDRTFNELSCVNDEEEKVERGMAYICTYVFIFVLCIKCLYSALLANKK